MTAAAAVLRPECQLGECELCKPGEVRTPTGGILVFPARRCDCPCHRKRTAR